MPFAAQYMYDIVNDVSAYPDFLPWCGGAKTLSSGEDYLEAAVLMKKGPLNHWFSTRNQLTENEKIDMQLLDGPFRKLQGAWIFQALDSESCKISLDLEFEFSNMLTSTLLTPVFSQIANTMVDSFCTRAQEMYTA